MSETLIGVLIGGIIASIAPVVQLCVEHRRWRREAYLEYCKSERQRFDELYERLLEEFGDGLKNDSYSSSMVASLETRTPKEVAHVFEDWMKVEDRSEFAQKVAFRNMATAMRRHLASLDEEIRECCRK